MKPHVVIKCQSPFQSSEAIDKASLSEEPVYPWSLDDDEMVREVLEGILFRSILARIVFIDIDWYFRSGFEYYADGDESGLFCAIGIENFDNEQDYREFRKALLRNDGILILTIYDVTKESFKVNWASKSILDFRSEEDTENFFCGCAEEKFARLKEKDAKEKNE